MKTQLKKFKAFLTASNLFMRFVHYLYFFNIELIRLANKAFSPRYLDIGSGSGMSEIRWRNLDIQDDGELISETTKLNFKPNSIDFVYCSHFFEHIEDSIAENLLKEAHRVLKPGGTFRLVVPNQQFFIDEYYKKNLTYLKERIQKENLDTWHIYGTDVNSPEQLLIGVIAGIHNKNHKLTIWPFEEDPNAEVPIFRHPFQHKLEGFYCGPPPGISDELIRNNLRELSAHEFSLWLFNEAKISEATDGVFPSWHKNDWNINKFKKYANDYGYSSCEESEFGKFNFNILNKKNREAFDKKPLSLYVNYIK